MPAPGTVAGDSPAASLHVAARRSGAAGVRVSIGRDACNAGQAPLIGPTRESLMGVE